MKRKKSFSKLLSYSISLAFLLSIPYFCFAKDTVVKGTVTDQEGNHLKNAKITLLDPSRGLKFELKSDKKGNFIKVGIPLSFYKITVELEGYFTLESQVRLRFGMTENVSIKLRKMPPSSDTSGINNDKDLNEGINFFRLGSYDKAIESFKKVIEKFPSDVEGYYNLGLAYLRKEDIDQAIASLEKATELSPDIIQVHLALGECYFNKGETEKALEIFKNATGLQPEDPKTYYNLGIAYYKLDKTKEALVSFDLAIELNPEFSSAYYQAGLAATKMGDFKRAIKYFEGFLKLESEAPEANQVKVIIEDLKKRIG